MAPTNPFTSLNLGSFMTRGDYTSQVGNPIRIMISYQYNDDDEFLETRIKHTRTPYITIDS